MLKNCKRSRRTLLTTNGVIVYDRTVLIPADKRSAEKLKELEGEDARSVVPLDIYLGIDKLPFKVSEPLMEEICFFAIRSSSYQEAEDEIRRIYGLHISDDTMRKIVNWAGKIVFDADCREAAEKLLTLENGSFKTPRDLDGVLYLETDGAALPTRLKNEDGSVWRENKLGIAFTSDTLIKWRSRKDGQARCRIGRREYVSFIGAAEDFRRHFFALAARNGYGRYRETVLISDGATWIRNLKEMIFPDAQQILDLFHLKENVGKFAMFVFKSDPKKAGEVADRWCQMLEDGRSSEVLLELAPYKDKKMPEGIVNLHNYIVNNRDNIDYPAYRAKGYFVGSGAIESANKSVIQARMKLVGMRWNVTTAQYVASLRAKERSGLWHSVVCRLLRNAVSHQKTSTD